MCKIANGICVAVFDQMVEKATIVLYPAVESIKALTVCYIHYPQSFDPSKTQFTKSTWLLLKALENLRI